MAEHGLTISDSIKRNSGIVIIPVVLFLQLTTAVAGLTSALKGPDWASLWLCLLLGLALAWLLAFLHQSGYKSLILLIVVGFLYILLVPGGLAGTFTLLGLGGARWMFGLSPFYKGEKIDISQLAALVHNLSYSLFVIVQRLQGWIKAMGSGKPAFDPLAVALAWNGLVWIVAIWAGWMVETRQNALLAVSPSVLLSLGTLSSGQNMFTGLYPMLGLTLLLLALVQQTRRQQGWISGGIAFPVHKGRQIINFALFVTIVLVILSITLPSLSAQRIRRWIDELRKPPIQQQSALAQSLGILPGGTPVPDKFQAVRSPGLPRDHLIGSEPDLSSRIVMTVKVDNLAALSSGNQPLPLYWRGFTYDVYTGRGWITSETKDYPVAANAAIQADQAVGHLAVLEEFFPIESLGGTIYAAGDPAKVNYDSEAAWRSPGDLFGVQASTDAAYTVVSLVPVADDTTLRQSGENYPDWVRQRFLALPADVPDRVKALAIRLTASGITPYDRAVAIEKYLRTYPYTLDVPYPPPQRDVADYFLFDLKKGYCDYFATAMVVLARSAGIPARLAIGYATGTYNLNSKRFSISEADAHSWAELYFPGIGWVPFEATPSHPALDRTLPLPVETPTPGSNLPGQVTGIEPKANLFWFLVPVVVLSLVAMLGLVWFIMAGAQLFFLPEPVSIAEVYRQMKRMAARLGTHMESGDTPYEFLAAFSTALDSLPARGIPASITTRLIGDTRATILAIVQNRYQASGYLGKRIIQEWLDLRWRLWLVWILIFFSSIGFRRHSQIGSIGG